MVWIGGKFYNEEEYDVLSRKESEERMARYWAEAQAQERERQEEAQLLRRMGAAYTEYKNFLETRPHLRPKAAGDPAGDRLFYEQLRQNLGHADDAPRCSHVKADGLHCGSPRLKTGTYCYTHQRMLASRSRRLPLLAMEDANSIQLSLMEVSRALLDREISEKTAALLLYALQTASSNVRHTTFHKAPAEMVVEEPAPPPAAEARRETPAPDPSIYDGLDNDLKLKLQEIGDEFDRRVREKRSREMISIAASAPEPRAADRAREVTETNAQEDKSDHTDAEFEPNPKLLTAADNSEHAAPPGLAARFETALSAVGDAAQTTESRRMAASDDGLSP